VIGLVRETEQVMRLTLRLPPFDRLDFIPGQFVGIRHGDGFDRSFSIANAPRQDGTIELHVGRVSGGTFTGHVLDRLRLNDILQLAGPFGSFTLAAEPRASIFIAGGTGIAPVRAILEQITAKPCRGGRVSGGLYLDRELLEFSSRHRIGYVPVISGRDKIWAGRTGLVHEAVLQDFGNLAGFDVYACGHPAMVEAAREAACSRGASPDRFFSDSFYPSRPAAEFSA
jgi:NAD(P)H-flavin reductase